jgi:hypothetical protein
MRTLALLLAVGLVAVGFVACTKPTASSTAPAATCAKLNAPCQYADGKIGLCNASSLDCDGSPQCLVCMSLH